MNFLYSIIVGMCAGILGFGSLFVMHSQPSIVAGSFTPVQGKSMTLAGAGISSSATTVTLSSATLPDPNATPILMSMFGAIGYGVFEPQSSKIENFSFTGITQNANGSATLTGVSRGLSFYSPYAASTTLQISHAGGSNVILSNSAAFYGQQFALLNTNESITGTWTFASTAPPKYDYNPTFGALASTTLASKGYVDASMAAGAVPITTNNAGIGILATALQAASSTATGVYNAITYNKILAASYATDTPNTGTRTSDVLMSDLTGYLTQGWLNLTKLFTFTGGLTSTATTTLAGSNVNSNAIVLNGVPYSFPSTLLASSSVLSIDTAGNTTWETPTAIRYTYATTTGMGIGNSSYATSTTLTIPAGVLTASSTIEVILDANMAVSAGSPTCDIFLKDSNSNVFFDMSIPATRAIFRTVIMGNNSASSQVAINPTLSNAFTSSINLAAGVSFLLVDRGNYTGGATGVCNLNDAQIIVTR